ncbi:hypothetical protein Droror1_Dr00026637 [Drosera rotundifolia]
MKEMGRAPLILGLVLGRVWAKGKLGLVKLLGDVEEAKDPEPRKMSCAERVEANDKVKSDNKSSAGEDSKICEKGMILPQEEDEE